MDIALSVWYTEIMSDAEKWYVYRRYKNSHNWSQLPLGYEDKAEAEKMRDFLQKELSKSRIFLIGKGDFLTSDHAESDEG